MEVAKYMLRNNYDKKNPREAAYDYGCQRRTAQKALFFLEILKMKEMEEGEVITPHTRHVERDALQWQILSRDGEEVTFRAGTEVFRCHKGGIIYREWEKEANRRAAGGSMYETYKGMVLSSGPEPVFGRETPDREGWSPIQKGESMGYVPLLKLIDSQLEERQHRIEDLRKRAAVLDWCDHDKGICTGKCELIDDIRSIEKRILGDP